MNRRQFKDISRHSSLANDIDEEEDPDEEDGVGDVVDEIDGEEEGTTQFNEAGEVLEPFNLRDERDMGHVDGNMNFVFRKEEGEVDAWLADLDEAAMEKGIGEAAAAMKRRSERMQELERAEEAKEKPKPTKLFIQLLSLMEAEEMVNSAVKRLRGKGNSRVGRNKKDRSDNNLQESDINKKNMLSMLEWADQLIEAGCMGVYEMTTEAVDANSCLWEYTAADGSLQGPFTAMQIAAWKKQHFFTGPTAVYMRRVEGILPFDEFREENASEAKDAPLQGLVSPQQEYASFSQPVKRKVSFESGSQQKKVVQCSELEADLESDEEEGSGRQQRAQVPSSSDSATIGSKVLSSHQNILERYTALLQAAPRGEWMLSDDIDFGEGFIQGKVLELATADEPVKKSRRVFSGGDEDD